MHYDLIMMNTARPISELLREWRQRRRMSQLGLACEADISARHLSFLETGRAQPSRDMVLHLAERLDVPLRERNALLHAAGFAPVYSERALDDPALQAARTAIDLVLAGHEPYPALAIDRHWTLIASNQAVARLLLGVDPVLLQAPVNVLRLSLHPAGIAPRIVNLVEWRTHLLGRLRHQIDACADPVLVKLLDELTRYPQPEVPITVKTDTQESPSVVVPLQLMTEAGMLTFLSKTMIFGTPVDITLAELTIESFFPANAATAKILRDAADK